MMAPSPTIMLLHDEQNLPSRSSSKQLSENVAKAYQPVLHNQ
jgi:hypothetical protein